VQSIPQQKSQLDTSQLENQTFIKVALEFLCDMEKERHVFQL
jgi:hypothetical protein